MNSKNKKIIKVALSGMPNVGKSSLLNYFLQEKLSIVSNKPQTTIENIKGILNVENTQIIFIDTPGIFKANNSIKYKNIVKNAWSSVDEVDLVCFMIDSTVEVKKGVLTVLSYILERKAKVILLLNKSDKSKLNDRVNIVDSISNNEKFQEIFAISATNGKGINDLLQYILSEAREGNWEFNDDELTDRSMKELCHDFIREKIFIHTNKEIPYSTEIEIEKLEETEESLNLVVNVIVDKENHKKIIIGTKGKVLKTIIHDSAIDIEKMSGKKTSVFIIIKVAKK